jgi:serine/threonine protein kinase/Tol biopolymer transport system component
VTLSTGTQLGPYEVLRPLGAGGMGEVYRARDQRLGRDVALKVLPQETSSDASRLRRFEREARSASALNHPNIVTVYEIGSAESVSYIAMELVEGKTLREGLVDGALPIRRLLQLAVQLADGLARAHDAGIVHRDLKPENVMVTKEGRIKILDFGVAKLSQPEIDGAGHVGATLTRGTEPGVVLGTVGYMSPEQAGGRSVDFRSDQFSFGSILYEMATGRRAFHRETAVETLAAIVREEPEAIGASRPDVPAPLRWIVERCLAKEPEDRYASTKDLARELATVRDRLSETSGLSPAVSPLRRPRLAALLATVLIAGLAGVFLLGKRLGDRPLPSFRRLTFRSGSVIGARFAPDGQTIVYTAGWASDPISIFSTRSGSVESRALAPGARLLSISSTGEMLVLRQGTLARVSLAGGAEREILGGVLDADWAPNAHDIAVVRRAGATAVGGALALMETRLEYPIGRVLYESRGRIGAPRVSPKGELVAFLDHPQSGGASGSVAVVDRKGMKRRLSEEFKEIHTAGWSPRGDEVWFSARPADASTAIYAVSLSGRQRVVAQGPGGYLLQDVSRDGRALLSLWHRRSILMALTPGQTTERDLSWLDESQPVALSDDGRTLLFTEEGEGAGSVSSVWKRQTDGSPAVRLGEGLAVGLSPDGMWALAVRPQPEPAQLVLIPTGAGEPRSLTNDAIDHRGAAWFPDGQRVLFVGSEPGKRLRLYVQGLDGGTPRAISADCARGTTWTTTWMTSRPISPDGRQVVWFCGEYLLYPVDGGEPRPIPGLARGEIPAGWDADGRALYVRNFGQTPIKVFRVDVSTGQRQLWKEIPVPPQAGLTELFTMTPDGKSYAYGYYTNTSDLFLVVGLK